MISTEAGGVPGEAIISSSSRVSFACASPETNFSYSSCNFFASVFLILIVSSSLGNRIHERAYSSTRSPILLTLRAADSNIGLVKSIESDSIQTLSNHQRPPARVKKDSPILCASSKTMILSFDNSAETFSATFGSRR